MSANETSWGWSGRHYAEGEGTERPNESTRQSQSVQERPWKDAEERWRRLLDATCPEAHDEVLRAVRRWNEPIRGQLRTEMALRLTVDGETVFSHTNTMGPHVTGSNTGG